MNRINILSQETSNKIAAGEVVERPASVVKELVENSIDAGAKNISVEIEDGGHRLIRVVDDGHGIHPDDISKAFTTHGTSKIKDIEDVYKIKSLGFRGEALPSIASVSNTRLISRNKEFDYGKEIYISGGKIQHEKEVGASVGTNICVENLFFNVPARQKFLKTAQREGSLVNDYMMRLALSNSDVSFKLYKNGKKTFSTYGSGDLKETIRALYGKEVYNNIIYFENHSDTTSIYGYIGNADISKGSRNRQSIFINKRLIKNRMITTAVENAFKSFLTVNKFPFFVLFIDIFPELIDVNIHPTKSEIKFKDDRQIFKIVFDGVHKALRKSLEESFMIDIEESASKDENKKAFNADELNKLNMELEKLEGRKEIHIPIDLKPLKSEERNNSVLEFGNRQEKSEAVNRDINIRAIGEGETQHHDIKIMKNLGVSDGYDSKEEKINEIKDINTTVHEQLNFNYNLDAASKTSDLGISEDVKIPKFEKINIIGQFNKTYILGEANNTLYIIDQHAAHEKVLFEKYSKEIDEKKVISQIILTPVVMELTPNEFAGYVENKEIFNNAGFIIEEFGENTINIKEVPLILGIPKVEKLFMDILDNLTGMGSGKTSEVKYNAIATMACKSAIKAHDLLSNEEMEHLLEELRYIDNPFTCPHGRPTIIKYTLTEVEKLFKRIQ